ncbi:hypothetical protein LPJ79_003801 [Coemansia sp. RSA 1821]|nr:hypothetical protein LPJ79_003801 [Coemansia sp. RSA 1821]
MERQSTELHELLNAVDMMQYYDAFKREGFERLEAIVDIQESDFEAMGVKRGHRRPAVRQRQRGHSVTSQPPVASTSTASRRRGSRADPRSPYLRPVMGPQSPKSPQAQVQQLMPQSPRRTYRRHPKKDPNAPEKWRSAYQLFRDDVNQELHGQEIPFSEMSKIHSKRWAELDDHTRNMYFQRSKNDKEEYLRKMAIYEDTAEYKVCLP